MAAIGVHFRDSWGIGNLRQTAGFPVGLKEKFHYVCPLGPCIVTWDMKTKERINMLQCHSDLITILLKCDATDAILSLSYSGHGILHDVSLDTVWEFQIPGNNVVYAAWDCSGRNFSVCTIGRRSMMAVYEVIDNGKRVNLKWIKSASDGVGQGEAIVIGHRQEDIHSESSIKQDNVGVGTQDSVSDTKVHSYECYYGCLFTNKGTLIGIFQHGKKPFEVHLFNLNGVLLSKKAISPFDEPNTTMLCMSECKNGVFAIGLQRGLFVFLDCVSLDITSVFQSQGSAQVCLWDNDRLITASYQTGVLEWWSTRGELMNEVTVGGIESVVHLSWSVPGIELWIGGITSLDYAYLKPTELIHASLHTVAGCGISFKDETILASGDLAGNVFINEKNTKCNVSDLQMLNVRSSVRCLCWIREILFIGTLEGVLFAWNPKRQGKNFEKVYVFSFSVLTMRKNEPNSLLAIGTAGGNVCVFDTGTTGLLKLTLEENVHNAAAIGDGPEQRPMEIWSIAWNPSFDKLATASEDKTTIVIDSTNGSQITQIIGHTTAVTSVDWKILSNGDCILATCADDKTVRVNDGKRFELLYVLKAVDIHGWYTFTYLSINPFKDWILCSTQNGHIVMWDLVSQSCLFCKKLHCGSIEGLEWDQEFKCFASIGSDCIVNICEIMEDASSTNS